MRFKVVTWVGEKTWRYFGWNEIQITSTVKTESSYNTSNDFYVSLIKEKELEQSDHGSVHNFLNSHFRSNYKLLAASICLTVTNSKFSSLLNIYWKQKKSYKTFHFTSSSTYSLSKGYYFFCSNFWQVQGVRSNFIKYWRLDRRGEK